MGFFEDSLGAIGRMLDGGVEWCADRLNRRGRYHVGPSPRERAAAWGGAAWIWLVALGRGAAEHWAREMSRGQRRLAGVCAAGVVTVVLVLGLRAVFLPPVPEVVVTDADAAAVARLQQLILETRPAEEDAVAASGAVRRRP